MISAILAPCMPPKGQKPEPKENDNGEEEIEVSPIYFKVVHVFDISQIDGEPLPEFEVPSLTGEINEELFERVMSLTRKLLCYRYRNGTIAITIDF